MHYYVIVERGPDGWYMTFPNGGAGYSYAERPEDIVPQARDWLESSGMYGGSLPRSIEDGALPPTATDLADFDTPLIVVIPFEAAETKAAA